MALDQLWLVRAARRIPSRGRALDLVREAVILVCQEFDRSQAHFIDRYECTATRTTERNGHRSRVLSTNKELKHPCRVVSIFPDEATVIRLGGAVLFDIHDE